MSKKYDAMVKLKVQIVRPSPFTTKACTVYSMKSSNDRRATFAYRTLGNRITWVRNHGLIAWDANSGDYTPFICSSRQIQHLFGLHKCLPPLINDSGPMLLE